jgi:integrase
MAIEDDCVRKNPFDFQLSEVIEDDSKPKVALSGEQEAGLLDFMKQDRTYQKYHDDVLILLKTGLRISKLCGLTRSDIDFKNHAIRINHQLLKDKDGFYIAEPKTKSGFRNVPMSDET